VIGEGSDMYGIIDCHKIARVSLNVGQGIKEIVWEGVFFFDFSHEYILDKRKPQ
jgi:hypothetical protein